MTPLTDSSKCKIKCKIGVDFGGVLSIHDGGNVFGHFSTEINIPDALESLYSLSQTGKTELSLISFAGKTRSHETAQSINNVCPNLFDNLFFVKKTTYKKDVCDLLGADIMIDDTLDILLDIRENNPRIDLIWFTSLDKSNELPKDSKIKLFSTWRDMLKYIQDTYLTSTEDTNRRTNNELNDLSKSKDISKKLYLHQKRQ